jgi:hypothetical protein
MRRPRIKKRGALQRRWNLHERNVSPWNVAQDRETVLSAGGSRATERSMTMYA